MHGELANRLKTLQSKIMAQWTERALSEVDSASGVDSLALANSIPLYLQHLAEALATNKPIDFRAVQVHDAEGVRIGKLHGTHRAASLGYILTEVIFEYHILREVIFKVLEDDGEQLPQIARDIIISSVEQAVNDASVRFVEVHSDIQQKFISTLTHDLRNPISAAKTNAQLVLRKAADPDACVRFGGRIITSLNRLDAMIQDLLDGSRLRAGEGLSIELGDCDLGALAEEVVDEMAVMHGDRFTVQLRQPLYGSYSCDGIRRMLENLIGNAVKYSTPRTPIEIKVQRVEDYVHFSVRNDGNPISVAEQSILFEQYRRTKGAELSRKPGWGLGLTLVKGVAEAHRGIVRVESSESAGTTFTVELPWVPVHNEEVASPGASS